MGEMTRLIDKELANEIAEITRGKTREELIGFIEKQAVIIKQLRSPEVVELSYPIKVELPDDWIDKVIERMKNDPDSEWVNVIKCKDCKHGSPNGEYGCRVYHYRRYETHDMKPDDFCSRAERRQE